MSKPQMGGVTSSLLERICREIDTLDRTNYLKMILADSASEDTARRIQEIFYEQWPAIRPERLRGRPDLVVMLDDHSLRPDPARVAAELSSFLRDQKSYVPIAGRDEISKERRDRWCGLTRPPRSFRSRVTLVRLLLISLLPGDDDV